MRSLQLTSHVRSEVLAHVQVEDDEGFSLVISDPNGRPLGLLDVWQGEDGQTLAQVGGWNAGGEWQGAPITLRNEFPEG